MKLVLWDVDRTLLYVGDTDRKVYREVFREVVGREAERLPARGTGVTMPLAVRELLNANGVAEAEVEDLAQRIVDRLPEQLGRYRDDMRRSGQLMPGAAAALAAVHQTQGLVPTVLTGNLQESAQIKLGTFSLLGHLDMSVGGFASDSPHRPALVEVAQRRSASAYECEFRRENSVIIGDSLEDVRTGQEGGAKVIGVASGTTSFDQLADAGADYVLTDLTDVKLLLNVIDELTSCTS
ncbi:MULTISPECIES: HAD family hydrolase [Streptomyces]|uniref:Phosphoglycolate phosphatase n=2 Tax=Streptomyces TaxID=1883 RepID=A0A1E7M233_9ACTN|nr:MULTISPECIES: haloacid dehalogenase-like hydrolase [Streptomyces]OEV22143.1 phosphoglycolate phosphatase [Streptomyces nanshensis]ONI49433.1 Phosphoglycolate phosphatase [Streptomyces sp. IB2014 011-1]RDV51674.1 phosphoglycolate phosphatase [Streptomyces sp. IB2014 011-12]